MQSDQPRNCPVCGKDEVRTIWHSFVSCNHCGMVYDRFPDPPDYAELESYSMAEPEPTRTAATLELLKPWLGNTALEIGCGRGELLESLRKHTEAHGIDPSAASISVCKQRGLSVQQADLHAVASFVSWDLIVMSHVLEHLTNPRIALEIIHSLLSADGHAYIEVPDATRYLDHLEVPLQEFNREHMNHFSPLLFMRLLECSGLEICSFGTRSIPLPNGGQYPAMWAVVKAAEPADYDIADRQLPNLMTRYAMVSVRTLGYLAEQAKAKINGDKVIAWGAGALAENLLPLISDRIGGCVDRDKSKHGKVIAGMTVTAPPPVGSNPILIASILNAQSVKNDIARMGLKNRVITLG